MGKSSKSSASKSTPSFAPEDSIKGIILGIDEAGRGPLAGPVVAACVYVPEYLRTHPVWRDVNDSKKMSTIKREVTYDILTKLLPYGIGVATPDEIDEINILNATFLAMQRAVDHFSASHQMDYQATHALLDGNRAPKNFSLPCTTLIKGDSLSYSIAGASVIAKVKRDQIMSELAKDFPAYFWDNNAGYGTPEHLRAIESHGFCPQHRKSFEPIKSMIQSKVEKKSTKAA